MTNNNIITVNLTDASASATLDLLDFLTRNGYTWARVGAATTPKATSPKGKPSKKPTPAKQEKRAESTTSKKPKAYTVTATCLRNEGKGHQNEVYLDRNVPYLLFEQVKLLASGFAGEYDTDVLGRTLPSGERGKGGFRFPTAAKAKAFVEKHPTITVTSKA